MDRTKALNIFRSFCMMIGILAGLALLALGIVNFPRLPKDVQLGIGLAVIIIIGTNMIYSTVYSEPHDDDEEYYEDQE